MPADRRNCGARGGTGEFRDAHKKGSTPATGDVLPILRPMPHTVPAAIRLRDALTLLLRAYSIRCRAIRPIRERDDTNSGSAPDAVN